MLRRCYSSIPTSMRAWRVESFGDSITQSTVPIPVLTKPDQVLVKVKASSVNPIDTVMCEGYGNEILTQWRRLNEFDFNASRLPFIPGRDFSGIVESVGGSVTSLRKGDEIFGVIPAMDPGCHAEFAVTNSEACVKKPEGLDHVECAAMPYVACTAWSAFLFARLGEFNAKENRVLIHGGSGGVGTMAIQILKAWGVPKIVVTCSPDSFDLVRSLGGIPVDYSASNVTDQIIDEGPFEVIIDCVDSELSRWSDKIMGVWRNCVHVSVVSPMMRDTDRYGIPVGLASTALKYLCRSAESALQGKWFSYAYFLPHRDCLETISKFAEEKKIRPIVEKVFSFDEAPKAYEKVAEKNGRGKTVLKFD